MKSLSSGVFEVALMVVNAVIAVGDKIVNGIQSFIASEFFLMIAAIAGLLFLLKLT